MNDNVGTCKIQKNTGYYGCIFDNFTFINTFVSLKKENNESYIIYFSSESNTIYLPSSFINILQIYPCFYYPNGNRFICNENKGYKPLILRNDNMIITLEVDRIYRYEGYMITQTNIEREHNIQIHDKDYLVFPMTMFKNFHVQFDIENGIISFYSNDKSLLQVIKKEEPKSEPEPKTIQENEKENDGNSGKKIIIIIIAISGVLIIIIIGLIICRYCSNKRKDKSAEIEKTKEKFTEFEFDDSIEDKL